MGIYPTDLLANDICTRIFIAALFVTGGHIGGFDQYRTGTVSRGIITQRNIIQLYKRMESTPCTLQNVLVRKKRKAQINVYEIYYLLCE